MNYHVAIDIGASNGKVVLGWIENDELKTEILHTFANQMTTVNNHLTWDLEAIIKEIIFGLAKLKSRNIMTATVGIDTWGVDYVLLDQANNLVDDVYAYRDLRNKKGVDIVDQLIDRYALYLRTGIQFIEFNSIFQLATVDDEKKARVAKIMMLPSYLYYRLCKIFANEITDMSTTGLLDAYTHKVDAKLLAMLKLPDNAFGEIMLPKTILGPIDEKLKHEHNLPNLTFVLVGTHDTASAVAGIPYIPADTAFLSSGTWSLLGAENKTPIINETAFLMNYSNEITVNNETRFLKNIIGMWMLQEIKRLLPVAYDYHQLIEIATHVKGFQYMINCNDVRFLNPKNMIEEIKLYCREHNQLIPTTPGELTRCVIDSLALNYCLAFRKLSKMTERKLSGLHIIGGGSQNELLNQLTADLLDVTVTAGPTETSALGNLAIQCLATHDSSSLEAVKLAIVHGASIRTYKPRMIDREILISNYLKVIKD